MALAISMSLGLSFPGKPHQRSRSKFHSTQNGGPKASKNFILDISMPGAHPYKVKVLMLVIKVVLGFFAILPVACWAGHCEM